MTKTFTKIATEAELFVHDFLSSFSGHKDGLDSSHLMTIKIDNEVVIVDSVCSSPDIYDLIDEVVAKTPFTVRSSDMLAVIVSGWAAPLADDGSVEGAPSKHPERRRVRLMSCVRRSDLRIVSVVRFLATDKVVIDEGEAIGSLAEAMLALGNAGK